MTEKIKEAAWKDPRTGTIYTGNDHYECWYCAKQATASHLRDIEAWVWAEMVMKEIGDEAFYEGEGFVTTMNRFVDRDEALRIAKANGQVSQKARDGLRAEEMLIVA